MCADINAKMIRRHAHIFGDARAETPEEVAALWSKIKAAEHKEAEKPRSLMDKVPHYLSALTRAECRRLTDAAKKILLRAIDAGGTTISDFLNVDGSEGKFVRELKIYGRIGQPCPVCGSIVECVRQGGRSSFYCPKCQK